MNDKVKFDVVVVGGGVSGVSAAVAAARCGRRVALVERSDILGGMATLALVNPLQTFHAPRGQVIRGFGQEVVDSLIARNACLGYLLDPIGFATTLTPVDSTAFETALREKCRDAGVTLFFEHRFRDARLGAGNMLEAVVATAPDGGTLVMEAAAFVDASGNGDLTLASGADMELDPDHQPMTLMFILGGVNADEIIAYQKTHPQEFVLHPDPLVLDRGYVAVSGFFTAVAEARQSGELTVPRDRLLFFGATRRDEVVVNTTRILGLVGIEPRELEDARARGMAQVRELVDFMQRRIPGFSKAFLKTVAREAGVRETRRLRGRYILHENELIDGVCFDDVIAKGAFPLDIHRQTDSGLQTLTLHEKGFYDIPLRCLLNPVVSNLLTAGKCLSVTHVGFSSTRVMPTCMAVGQAGGAAAAFVALNPAADVTDFTPKIQRVLLEQNAVLFDEQVVW